MEHVDEVRRRFRDNGTLEELLERIYNIARSGFQSKVLSREPGLHHVASSMLTRMLHPIRHLDPSLPTQGGLQ